MLKTVLFQTIQFSISILFRSIWHIHRILSGATTPGHSGPGGDGNEGVLFIPQSFRVTGVSTSDCLVSYLRYSLWRFLPSLQRYSRCIQQPQQTGQYIICRHLSVDKDYLISYDYFINVDFPSTHTTLCPNNTNQMNNNQHHVFAWSNRCYRV